MQVRRCYIDEQVTTYHALSNFSDTRSAYMQATLVGMHRPGLVITLLFTMHSLLRITLGLNVLL